MLASETFGDLALCKRPMQVGDPFMEKLLVECTLELFAEELVVGIQDLGGAGLSGATSELASPATAACMWSSTGFRCATHARSEEILMSESQERMMAVVTPAVIDRVLAICAKWDVAASVEVGEVNESGRLTVEWRGEVVVEVPPRTVAHEGPVYERPFARPQWYDELQAPSALTRPETGAELRATLLTMVMSPDLCSRAWVTDQYDRYVRGNTVLAQPEDAGVVRIDEETGLGVALATDANGRYAQLDPYAGTQLALAEAYRNVAVAGARPLAVTNC